MRQFIGPFATPDVLVIVPGLPKTRSGKILRRILRKIASGEHSADQLGDTSTLADPAIVQIIIEKVGSCTLFSTRAPGTKSQTDHTFGLKRPGQEFRKMKKQVEMKKRERWYKSIVTVCTKVTSPIRSETGAWSRGR